jgi:hypothetical protein
MAPAAPGVAALKKNRAPDTRAVLKGKTLNIGDHAHRKMVHPAAEGIKAKKLIIEAICQQLKIFVDN